MERVDMDGDGDDDLLYSDRRGETRGIYWLERVAGQWRRHAIPASEEENMFLLPVMRQQKEDPSIEGQEL